MLKVAGLIFGAVVLCVLGFAYYDANRPFVCDAKAELTPTGNSPPAIDFALIEKIATKIGGNSNEWINYTFYIFSEVDSPTVGHAFGSLRGLRESTEMVPAYSPVKSKIEMSGVVITVHHPDKRYASDILKNMVQAFSRDLALEITQPVTVYCAGRRLP